MSLPTINAPRFDTILPSNGQKIEFRPFLVREEKILLMALEGGDSEGIAAAVVDVIQACVLSEVNIRGLPYFDVEWLFLQLRSKSVGEIIEMQLRHSNPDSTCEHISPVSVDLSTLSIDVKAERTIALNESIGVEMTYPNLDTIQEMQATGSSIAENALGIIAATVKCVYEDENVYADFTRAEMTEFLESLSSEQFNKITTFIAEMPKLSHTIDWVCTECGAPDQVVVEGLQGFFS